MSSKINIEQLEEYLKRAGLENGKLEEVLSPIKELNNQRRYGLVWEEPDNNTYNTDSAEKELLKNFPFLKEVNEHLIFNGEEHPDHLLIEGDNLHALKTMQYTHKNKIDVIYIDPPYNTGNTDFVYNDKFVDGEDSWRHSKWLSFMNKRLRLARELMTDEGVIFISIDDNEQAQLKLLCDQVFGEINKLSMFIWEKNPNPTFLNKYSRSSHEYVLAYAKDIRHVEGLYEKHVYEKTEDSQPLQNKQNPESVLTIGEGESDIFFMEKGLIEKGIYGKIELLDNIEVALGVNEKEFRIKGTFRFRQGYYNDAVSRGQRLVFKTKRMSPRLTNLPKTEEYFAPKSILNIKETTQIGVNEVESVLGDGIFSYPKPTGLIKHLISMVGKPNATVLDFFAGSGTTAHAVMELNKEDGGNRQAIVITNNEINSSEEDDLLVEKGYVEPFTGSRRGTKKHAEWLEKVKEFKQTPEYLEFIETDEYKDLGIARAVTEQRINKVINGYTTPKNKEVEGLSNNNFYHFEVVLEPDLMDLDLNTYVLINKTKDIIKMKEGVYTDELDISTNNTPAIKLVNEDKEVIVVQTVRVLEEDIQELVQNFNDEGKEHIIYTSYGYYEYNLHNIIYKELPKELLQAIKHNEGE